ncbi:MAG: hypothetical protein MZV64_74275 [Ignavibacteriales bacterium]|nr:hypothetical protein [Ignavibacteriales bacterium]
MQDRDRRRPAGRRIRRRARTGMSPGGTPGRRGWSATRAYPAPRWSSSAVRATGCRGSPWRGTRAVAVTARDDAPGRGRQRLDGAGHGSALGPRKSERALLLSAKLGSLSRRPRREHRNAPFRNHRRSRRGPIVRRAPSAGRSGAGKIIFFNWPMDPTMVNTFEGLTAERLISEARGRCRRARRRRGRDRPVGHDRAGRRPAHRFAQPCRHRAQNTGGGGFSMVGANLLSAELKSNPGLRLRLTLSCETLPDVPSANVIGEIRGSEKPQEIVVVGKHLGRLGQGDGGARQRRRLCAGDRGPAARDLGLKPADGPGGDVHERGERGRGGAEESCRCLCVNLSNT